MKSTQYNVSLAITGGIRDTSREKLYQGLGLEGLGLESSLKDDGIESSGTFSKYLKVNLRSIFSKP